MGSIAFLSFLLILAVVLLILPVINRKKIKSLQKVENNPRDGRHYNDNHLAGLKKMNLYFRLGSLASVILCIGSYLVMAVQEIDTKDVGIPKTFGVVSERVLYTGLRLVHPWQSVIRMNIWQQSFERSTAKSNPVVLIGSDQIRVNTDITYHWILNPEYARLIYLHFGESYWNKIIFPTAASALRTGAAGFTWVEIVAEKRPEVQAAMTDELKKAVISKLVSKGIEPDIADVMFTFPSVDLRRAEPMAEKLLAAVELKKAALQEKERQVTLTSIEDEKAKRRKKEGKGLMNLFEQLPVGFDPNNLPALLQAQALKAIVEKENGDSDIAAYVISTGGGAAPVAALSIGK